MLKKLLSLFGAGNKDEATKPAQPSTNNARMYAKDEDEDELDEDDDDEEVEEEEWPEEEKGQQAAVELDPETLHGLNYTIEEFEAEVEKQVKEWIEDAKADGETLAKEDIDSCYKDARLDLYRKWTGANSNMVMQWEERNSLKHTGIASTTSVKHDENNPLLAPIHGVSLQDYAAISFFIASGADYNHILAQLGIDDVVYQEATALWSKRMEEDTSFSVTILFGQYYGTAENHPKLSAISVALSAKGKETLDKMKADRFFYEELCGARSAAFDLGLDGTKWIMDNYEVSLGEFQKIATFHMENDQRFVDLEKSKKYSDYMVEKMEEYKKKFAEEQGGNVADDINF